MIRLMIEKYTLEEKKVLYRALVAGMLSESCGEDRQKTVETDLDKAADWLFKQIKKEETGNGQNS